MDPEDIMHRMAENASGSVEVCRVMRRENPSRIVYAPNYWQWFAHQRNHANLPPGMEDCPSQLELIRRLGLSVFSRNIYCDPTRGWFGGLSEEETDGLSVTERRCIDGGDTVTERTYHTKAGVLTERKRYVFAESTLVQEQFLLDESAPQWDAFLEIAQARSWEFLADRYGEIRDEVGSDGVVVAGELISPLKLLHLAAGADKSVYLLADYPERCREIMDIHEAEQLELLKQMLSCGVEAVMAMDNLDSMFHPPAFVEQYSARFYEAASRLCHDAGSSFFIHACGQQMALLPLIGSLGVDGLEGVVFPPLGDIDLDEAMKLGGDRLIITGGISAAEFMRLRTRSDVFDYIRDLFTRIKPYANRFMLSASCNTPYTASWEQITWFRDAWLEYGDIR
jgi:uroporphyrinogen-III decarboxylase